MKEIFFLCSSRTTFTSPEAREAFFQQWTQIYFDRYSNFLSLSIADNGDLEGYLTGCPDTVAYLSYQKSFPYLEIFRHLYESFPAHLHMNCHPRHQGKGVGRRLIQHFTLQLKQSAIQGIHLITAPTAANVGFYQATGFDYSETISWNETQLLFMGRRLSDQFTTNHP